ncbi:hypothetical protein LZZ85_17830 [Terrimonas sp. NA20]|uniref:Uncharacterized protein n=1 Tax=Terrimonas ginsenosidimutans TaxID=2908004 RepID=A0ABS9KUY9_9BACT|nr:hypothetical protein [Terrimonas ginsenosidimutans]MCG2616162.1 hypothetical protein [Terrimonas ginsenosidimutans]
MNDKISSPFTPDKPTIDQLIEKSRELKEESKKTCEQLQALHQDADALLDKSNDTHDDSPKT